MVPLKNQLKILKFLIAGINIHMKYCEYCLTEMQNVSKIKRFCSEYCRKSVRRTGKIIPCIHCSKEFYVGPKDIGKAKYCSQRCMGEASSIARGTTLHLCKECGKSGLKRTNTHKKNTKNIFCSTKCAAIFRSKNNCGTRTSSYEKAIRKILENDYKDEFIYNDRKTLGGLELDIYSPSRNIAFEIQGPTHYGVPVYGKDISLKVQENDAKKRAICQQLGIKLVEIDVRYRKGEYKIQTQERAIQEVLSNLQ